VDLSGVCWEGELRLVDSSEVRVLHHPKYSKTSNNFLDVFSFMVFNSIRKTKTQGALCMKVEVEIPDGEILQLAKDIMDNMPEYSMNLRCVGWKYEKGVFLFEELGEDDEELDDEGKPKRYTVTVEEIAAKGLKMFIERTLKGTYHFDGIHGLQELLDAGCYDAPAVDAIVQLTIFEDIIYG
jgi:hypothetical protein